MEDGATRHPGDLRDLIERGLLIALGEEQSQAGIGEPLARLAAFARAQSFRLFRGFGHCLS